MNLFNHFRLSYGQSTVKHLRNYEKCEKKIQRHRYHLVFSLRCRDLSLTPSSLKLKCPVNTNRAKDIIKRAEKALTRERIHVLINKIATLKTQKEQLEKKVFDEIPPVSDLGQKIAKHIETVKESRYTETKTRHLKMLSNLVKKSAEKNKYLLSKKNKRKI